jgi:nitroreductase
MTCNCIIIHPAPAVPEEDEPMTPMDALLSRASASALREPAPEGAVLEQVLQAGLRAPDHGRLRPWRFVLIRGEARAAWAGVVQAAMRARDPEVPQALLDRQQARILSVPLILALGVQIQPGHKIPEIEQMLSVGAAAMNMLNALHALDFGGIWVTGPNAYDPAVAATLGLPPEARLAGFLYIGTPAEPRPQPRRPALDAHISEWTGLSPLVRGEAE